MYELIYVLLQICVIIYAHEKIHHQAIELQYKEQNKTIIGSIASLIPLLLLFWYLYSMDPYVAGFYYFLVSIYIHFRIASCVDWNIDSVILYCIIGGMIQTFGLQYGSFTFGILNY